MSSGFVNASSSSQFRNARPRQLGEKSKREVLQQEVAASTGSCFCNRKLLLQQEVLRPQERQHQFASSLLKQILQVLWKLLTPLPLPFSQPTTRPQGVLNFVSANAPANQRSDWMDRRVTMALPSQTFFPSPDELAAAAGRLLTYCNNQYVCVKLCFCCVLRAILMGRSVSCAAVWSRRS